MLLDGHRGWQGNRIRSFLSLLLTAALHPRGRRLWQSPAAQSLISHPLWEQQSERQEKQRETDSVVLWSSLAAVAFFLPSRFQRKHSPVFITALYWNPQDINNTQLEIIRAALKHRQNATFLSVCIDMTNDASSRIYELHVM